MVTISRPTKIDLGNYPHLYWSGSKKIINLDNPRDEIWWYSTVLREGRTKDIQELPLDRVRELLPSLSLPPFLRNVWQKYFEQKGYIYE